MSIILGYDPVTLRERVDLLAAGKRLDELGEMRSLSALNEKVGLLRMVERLDEALDVANQALRQARFTGDREEVALARARRAQVLQYSGHLDDALTELAAVADEAHAHEWQRTEAYALQHRGRVLFDQGEWDAALRDFRAAADLRRRLEVAEDELESSLIAVAVVESFLDERRRTSRA
ncbi:hypothetical protein OSC27_12860 [Microbacterium sp. STN6]|uniref:hypothetical protein n=1 Tax=Microbacterium sp. STN6 TaxID=2995588 RepID=UPI0022608258|nr:hypothetical protein [Microbacterium sp. STN6]MCX7523162.1 hypothetical protein [Microbacterium sp. STN6]